MDLGLGACPKSHAELEHLTDPTFNPFQMEYEVDIFSTFVDECNQRILVRAAHRRLEKTIEENANMKMTNLVCQCVPSIHFNLTY